MDFTGMSVFLSVRESKFSRLPPRRAVFHVHLHSQRRKCHTSRITHYASLITTLGSYVQNGSSPR
jgi:hypothetical protein